MKKIFFFLLFLLLPESVMLSQEVDPSTAQKVAVAYFQKYNVIDNVVISDIMTLGLDKDTLLYVISFEKKGFVIIPNCFSVYPVLGQCFSNIFDTIDIPPGLSFLLDKYMWEISKIRENNIKPTKDIEKKWEEILSGEYNASKSYTVGESMLQTTWGQYDMYGSDEHPIFCTGVAMAQILYYYSCRITGPTAYYWINMNLDSEDSDNAWLIHDCCVACERPNHPGSSTPGRARDAFVDDFTISSSADVKWRIWHLSNWDEMLKDEIDLERPLLYSAGSIIPPEGHSWVIDGYNQDDQFHCNWGWSGAYNGFYSLGGFNPGGNSFNEIESAIFNVVPVQPSGVAIPELTAQSYTYNPNGYSINIPEAYGATSYEWNTQYGSISGNGTNVTLYSDYTTNVNVRAYNNKCDIYSSYDSESMTINYGPISGSTLICSSGSQYSIPNIPANATISWSNGSYVNRVSSQGSNPCTFSATGIGSSWIGAQVTTAYGSKTLSNYSVWAGKPVFNSISGTSYGYTGQPYDFWANPARDPLSQSTYQWIVDSEDDWYFVYQYYDWVTIVFEDPGYYQIMARATNSCGQTNWRSKQVSISQGYYFSMYPNPASDIVTVDLIEPAENIDNLEKPLNFDVQILDYSGILHYSANKSGDSFTIPVSNLKEGSYTVRITYGKEVETLPLIIKH